MARVPAKPNTLKENTSYSRHCQEAPYSALGGVVVDGRVPKRFQVLPCNRERHQVGTTNRWRMADCLYSDLLGKTQALKAVNMPYNQALICIMTAESPKLCINPDLNSAYTFHRSPDRPQTTPHLTAASFDPAVSASCPTPLRNRNQSPSVSKSSLSSKRESMTTAGPVDVYIHKAACLASPKDVFFYHAKKSMSFVGPAEQHNTFDVMLKCVGVDWELHRSFIQKADTLVEKLARLDDPDGQKCRSRLVSDTPHSFVHNNSTKPVNEPARRRSDKDLDHMSVIHLDIQDSTITKRAMAIALGNLYHDEIDVELNQVAGVMAAADALGFQQLIEGCGEIMLKSINCATVCCYHQAASKYHQEQVVVACERWLELNLIPQLSLNIQLREMSAELLQKILKSARLFVLGEYSVFRTLVYWLFLQLNSDLQLMPANATVLSFFNCFPKSTAFLETDQGHAFLPLFQSLRLHGITDTNNIHDMQILNIVPQSWLVSFLSQHCRALQGGGDMLQMPNFESCSVRQGFIIDDGCHYHSQVLSLHGFHFDLKAVREDTTNTYTFYMERLKPGDPKLSFQQCERHMFSMRPDRVTRYCLTVQCLDVGKDVMHTTGIITQKFGLGHKTSHSQVLRVEDLVEPIYVTYTVLFPPS